MRRDRRERPRRGGREPDNRASTLTALRCTPYCGTCELVRSAGSARCGPACAGRASPKAEPGADAGPAAPPGAALISSAGGFGNGDDYRS
jgi:hypothetical protein